MLKIRPATPDDLDELRDLFERANDAPYPIGPVFSEKLRAGHEGEARTTIVSDGGTITAGMVTCGPYLRLLAVDRGHRRRGLGAQLLHRAEQNALDRGFDRLVIAAEPGNYFTPGVEASDQALLRFFRRRHYEPQSDAVNLQAALDDNRLLDVSPDPHVVPAEPDDRNEVVRWVAAEFGRIWAFEASRCFDHALPSLFLHREENEIRGFSAHAANNGGLGTYGPAGVARQWRRHGYGRGLLLASLTDLRERGFRSALIQWAAAVEFYRSVCGARVSERFVILEKRIGRSTNDE